MPISLSAYVCVIEYIVFFYTYNPKFPSTHKKFNFTLYGVQCYTFLWEILILNQIIDLQMG